MKTANISLRPVEEGDQEFLLELLAGTRQDQLLVDGPARAMLMRLQFDAQVAHNRRLYPRLEVNVVLVDGQRAGRLYVARGPAEIRLVDISLLPEFRRRRIGGQLLAQLQEEGRRRGVPLRLHVLHGNAAQHLYERHGFLPDQVQGLHRPLEWNPGA
jgi:ribosomal protein S18 acetylase RimI-like enzyme